MANLNPDTDFATQPEDAKDYIQLLESQLADATNQYHTSQAEATKTKAELARAEAWQSLLGGCLDSVEKTDRLAVDVIAGFKKSKNRASDICSNAARSFKAFQWMLDDMVRLTQCIEEFKCEVDKCVNALSSANPSDPLIVGLKKLQKALEDAINCARTALTEWLNVLKASQQLARQVGDKKGDALGFDALLQALLDDFEKGNSRFDYTGIGSWTTCTAPARPAFPLSGDIQKLETGIADVEKCLKDLYSKYDTAATDMAEAKACKDALEAALKAATETNACKTK